MRQYPSHRAQRQNWEGLEQRRPPHHLRRKQLARSRIDRRGSFRAVRAFVWDSRPLRPGTIHVVWTTLDDAGRPTCSTIWAPLSRKRAETKVGLDSGPVLRCSLRLRQGDSKARRLVSSTTRGTRRVRTGALAAPAVIARFHDSTSCADQCPPAGRAHARACRARLSSTAAAFSGGAREKSRTIAVIACRARLSSTVAAFSGGAREKSRTIAVIPKQLHFAGHVFEA